MKKRSQGARCNDAMSAWQSGNVSNVQIGSSGNVSARVMLEGKLFHIKHVLNASDRDQQLRNYRSVDKLLSGKFSWYVPLDDAILSEYEGQPSIVTIRQFVDGEEYSFALPQALSAIGVACTLLHIPVVDQHPTGEYVSIWESNTEDAIRDCVENFPASSNTKTAMLTHAARLIETARYNQFESPRLFHGDLHAGNILYRGRAVRSVIDWDDCGFSRHPIDLGKAFWSFCRTERGSFRLGSTRVRAFLSRVGPLLTRRMMESIPNVGAVYFLPPAARIFWLKSQGSEVTNSYVKWVETFWDDYERNIGIIEDVLSDGTVKSACDPLHQ